MSAPTMRELIAKANAPLLLDESISLQTQRMSRAEDEYRRRLSPDVVGKVMDIAESMAAQPTVAEMGEDHAHDADFETAYDMFIQESRRLLALLNATPLPEHKQQKNQ